MVLLPRWNLIPGWNVDVKCVSPLVSAHVPHITRGIPGKNCLPWKFTQKKRESVNVVRPAKKEGVNERVEVVPHLCLHPHHVAAPLDRLPFRLELMATMMMLVLETKSDFAPHTINHHQHGGDKKSKKQMATCSIKNQDREAGHCPVDKDQGSRIKDQASRIKD